MATLTFDTYQLIQSLTKAGMPETQAKTLAEQLQRVNLENVATKEDIEQLRRDIQQVKIDLLKWMIPILLGQTAVFAFLVQWLSN